MKRLFAAPEIVIYLIDMSVPFEVRRRMRSETLCDWQVRQQLSIKHDFRRSKESPSFKQDSTGCFPGGVAPIRK